MNAARKLSEEDLRAVAALKATSVRRVQRTKPKPRRVPRSTVTTMEGPRHTRAASGGSSVLAAIQITDFTEDV